MSSESDCAGCAAKALGLERPEVIYVSGPFMAESVQEVEMNILTAKKYFVRLWDMGYAAINIDAFRQIVAQEVMPVTQEDYAGRCLAIAMRCDAIFMVPGWERSKQCTLERAAMMQLNKPVFLSLREAEEARRPRLGLHTPSGPSQPSFDVHPCSEYPGECGLDKS